MGLDGSGIEGVGSHGMWGDVNHWISSYSFFSIPLFLFSLLYHHFSRCCDGVCVVDGIRLKENLPTGVFQRLHFI
jgi:hypothetical protein